MKRPLKNITAADLGPVWANPKISADRIGAALGCSGSAVRQKAKRLGLPPRGHGRDACKYGDDELFREMWLAGVNIHEMRAYFGFAQRQGVRERRVALGLPPRARGKGTGTHSGWGTITLAEFREMQLAKALARDPAATGAALPPEPKRVISPPTRVEIAGIAFPSMSEAGRRLGGFTHNEVRRALAGKAPAKLAALEAAAQALTAREAAE